MIQWSVSGCSALGKLFRVKLLFVTYFDWDSWTFNPLPQFLHSIATDRSTSVPVPSIILFFIDSVFLLGEFSIINFCIWFDWKRSVMVYMPTLNHFHFRKKRQNKCLMMLFFVILMKCQIQVFKLEIMFLKIEIFYTEKMRGKIEEGAP